MSAYYRATRGRSRKTAEGGLDQGTERDTNSAAKVPAAIRKLMSAEDGWVFRSSSVRRISMDPPTPLLIGCL